MLQRLKPMVGHFVSAIKVSSAFVAEGCKSPACGWCVAAGVVVGLIGSNLKSQPVVVSTVKPPAKSGCSSCAAKKAAQAKLSALKPQPDPLSTPTAEVIKDDR